MMFKILPAICLLGFLILGSATAQSATVDITDLPVYGSDGLLQGVVNGLQDVSQWRVLTNIQIEGSGWWTKPTFATPTVPINPDGTFSLDVVSGGLDNVATIYRVDVVPAGVTPPLAGGSGRVPEGLGSIATDIQKRFGPTLEFAGRQWAVKDGPLPVGPGPNLFSTQPSDVWADGDGLHLTINKHGDDWWATEVFLTEPLGYGTYTIQTDYRADLLDINATFGAFTWDQFGEGGDVTPHREIDIEDGRWGQAADPEDAQNVVQPWDTTGNRHRYTVPSLEEDSVLTRAVTWTPNRIEFLTLHGDHTIDNYPQEALVDHWVYDHDPDINHIVPEAGEETWRFNLWLNNGDPRYPADGLPIEVLITDFQFEPFILLPGDANYDGTVDSKDATILAVNWQTASGADWGMGDFNEDGAVDDIDATILAANWLRDTNDAAPSVPQPSALAGLLGLFLAGLISRINSSRS